MSGPVLVSLPSVCALSSDVAFSLWRTYVPAALVDLRRLGEELHGKASALPFGLEASLHCLPCCSKVKIMEA